jgi:hypothetical protein
MEWLWNPVLWAHLGFILVSVPVVRSVPGLRLFVSVLASDAGSRSRR